MDTRPFGRVSFRSIFYLTTGLLFGAIGLRSLLVYANSPTLPVALGLVLLLVLLFSLSELPVVVQWRAAFPIYVLAHAAFILLLLFLPGSPDFYAIGFATLGMQVAQRWSTRIASLCIALFTPLMAVPLVGSYGLANGIAYTLLYTFANALLASYALAARRAVAAWERNQALATELEQANAQLQEYAARVEQLAGERERHRLARELHDSVTQTIFSMTLCSRSALLLLEREPVRLDAQLDRLNELAVSAVSEMRALSSELERPTLAHVDLVTALERHLASRAIPEGLHISLDVTGDAALDAVEAQSLFRIAQEAINNVVKHAQASQACVRLHLAEPFWMEVEDAGCGFDAGQPSRSGVGLLNMCERAAEIGWRLNVESAPGTGTRVRVEKGP